MAKNTEYTPKQRLFAAAYVCSGNAAQSVRDAGYDTKYPERLGWKMLQDRKIADLVARFRAAAVDSSEPAATATLEYTRELFLRRADEVYRAAFKDKQYSAANRANETAGRTQGYSGDLTLTIDDFSEVLKQASLALIPPQRDSGRLIEGEVVTREGEG